MSLHRVEFPELIYPCWAYAFARNGKEFTLEWLKYDLDKVVKLYDRGNIGIGDILIWNAIESERSRHLYPVSIAESGVVVNKLVDYNCHVAVYEGDGRISQMVSFYDGCLPFIIRVSYLEEAKCPPDMMIKAEDLPCQK